MGQHPGWNSAYISLGSGAWGGPIAGWGLTLLLALLAGHSSWAVAGDQGEVDARLDQLFGEHEPYQAFLGALQQAAAAHDRERVAGMVSYPLRTRVQGRWVRLKTPAQFLAHYEELMAATTLDAVARQTYAQLFGSTRGAMIGNGQVWFSAVCADRGCACRSIKIIALNP